jgi:hypothetical protein
MPQMAAAARDYLAIPASEVSVERLFSAGRRSPHHLTNHSRSPDGLISIRGVVKYSSISDPATFLVIGANRRSILTSGSS